MTVNMKKKLSESILDKFSIDFLRSQVLKNAYGNDDTVIAKLDPRVLLAWYLVVGLVPWFVSDLWFLGRVLPAGSGDDEACAGCGAGAGAVCGGRVLADGVSLHRGAVLRRGRLHGGAAADDDAEGGDLARSRR